MTQPQFTTTMPAQTAMLFQTTPPDVEQWVVIQDLGDDWLNAIGRAIEPVAQAMFGAGYRLTRIIRFGQTVDVPVTPVPDLNLESS